MLQKEIIITPELNDDHKVEATVLDTLQLRRWLLSQGKNVTVLAPPALREWVRAELSGAPQVTDSAPATELAAYGKDNVTTLF